MSAHVREFPAVRAMQKLAVRVQPLWFHLLCAGAVLLAARAPMFGGLRPLGLSIAAAVTAPYALTACAGAAIGYAMSLSMDAAVPYLVAVVAIALLRVLTTTQRRKGVALAPALAGAVCYLASGLGLVLALQAGGVAALYVSAESLLVLGMAYLLRVCFTTPWNRAMPLVAESRAALLFALMAGVICLAPYSLWGLQLGHIAAASAALFAALSGREQRAAPVGIALSIALVAADPLALYAGFGIAAAALAAGFFLQESRGMTALVFCGAGFLGVPMAPTPVLGLLFMAELCVAGMILYFLPQRVFFAAPVATVGSVSRATLTTLAGRLDLLAGALSTVGSTLDAVCEKLPRPGENYADVCDAVCESVCKRCSNNAVCWTKGASDAYDAFNHMQSVLARRGYVTVEDIPQPLKGTCKLPGRLTASLSTAHRASVARRGAAMRSKTMRSTITEQYSALAAALACLAGQVYREEMPDKRRERRLERLFCELGAEPLEVTVATDPQGRVHVTVQVPRQRFTAEEQQAITKEVSCLCHCKFAPVQCAHAYATTQLSFAEQPILVPLFGQCSLPASGKVSADACKTFTDLRGCAHVLLCDGMGTGKAAAVDGNLAATLTERLLVAGFGAGEAARLVNVALSLKGDADAGATLDALSVNLYSGKAQLFKAGAAASFLLRDQSVTVLEGESLPIGILGSVTGRASSVQLQEADTLIMASDGAVSAGVGWLSSALASSGTTPPQVLAQRLAAEARTRSDHPDDITILCMRLSAAPTQARGR